jgi:MoaA/NifB/PqqE/SkfB family radical SAM enzyme
MKFTLRNAKTVLKALNAYDPKKCKTRLPGPLVIQIQTIDRCNGACRMCPGSTFKRSGPPNLMDAGLYRQILEDLGHTKTVRTIVLTLQNEPLLDPEIVHRVIQARKILGNSVRIVLITNGSLLTPERSKALLDAGIDSIHISIDAFYEETYRSIRPGLHFSEVVENTAELLRVDQGSHTVVRFLRQRANEREEKQFKHFWKSRGAQIFIFPLENRTGILDNFELLRGSPPWLRRRFARTVRDLLFPSCLLPFYSLNVLWDGRVILCCNDWGHQDIVGDLSSQSIQDVWNSDAINSYRTLLYQNHADQSLLCRDCSMVRKF